MPRIFAPGKTSACPRKPSGSTRRAAARRARCIPGETRREFGLCDMIGNVWEWCSDWYGQTYYRDAPDHNPKGPDTGLYRVLRGGSWFDVPPLFLTTSY